MPELINPMPDTLIIDPKIDDDDRAGEIIEAIRAVMKKYDCVLMVAPEGRPREMVLAKVLDPALTQARVFAAIKNVSPFKATWRRMKWRKE